MTIWTCSLHPHPRGGHPMQWLWVIVPSHFAASWFAKSNNVRCTSSEVEWEIYVMFYSYFSFFFAMLRVCPLFKNASCNKFKYSRSFALVSFYCSIQFALCAFCCKESWTSWRGRIKIDRSYLSTMFSNSSFLSENCLGALQYHIILATFVEPRIKVHWISP